LKKHKPIFSIVLKPSDLGGFFYKIYQDFSKIAVKQQIKGIFIFSQPHEKFIDSIYIQ